MVITTLSFLAESLAGRLRHFLIPLGLNFARKCYKTDDEPNSVFSCSLVFDNVSMNSSEKTDARDGKLYADKRNRPFPSSPLPQCQNEYKCETIHMKMCLPFMFISRQSRLILI